MEGTSALSACSPQLAQLMPGTSSSSLDSAASALSALSSFLAQSQGKYRGHLASLSGEQVCTEDFWREFAFYLTFVHKSVGRSAGLEDSTIRGYLWRALWGSRAAAGREGRQGRG